MTTRFLNAILRSYAQVLFSQNRVLGALLLAVTWFDPPTGFAGLLAVLTALATAYFFRFNRDFIESGFYSYNALLTGLGAGYLFQLNLPMLWVTMIGAGLTFFATLWFASALGGRGLPVLSLPFLAGIWAVSLGANAFSALEFREHFTATAQGQPVLLEAVTQLFSQLPFANAVLLYLRSLGAVFFQYSDLAGLLVAVGLFLHSRMAWLSSVVGFVVGYFFYQFMEGDFSTLIYTYVGFNFILSAVAISSFFLVPSRKSFGVLLLVMPLIALLIAALHQLFGWVQLPLYSLPFNISVLLFLAAMFLRREAAGLNVVAIQHFSPERNHYLFFNDQVRFQKSTRVPVALPVMGEWTVSQGHHGNITHRGDWAFAWDFDLRDASGSTFRSPGYMCRDYYCFDLPIVAPAAGWVVEVLDGIPDNDIGQVNLANNWGNTVVIQHAEGLYSKLSHLRAGTFLVKKGDYVQPGQTLARLGNSGRSPEPHLHFQMQATPYIGSKTLDFPISHYLVKNPNGVQYRAFSVPTEGETVCNVQPTRLLTEAFGFVPGKKYAAQGTIGGQSRSETWEACTTPQNLTYLWCFETRSILWFRGNSTLFYCTGFDGDQHSLLYLFYLGAYKVPLGYYSQLALTDSLPLERQVPWLLKVSHDLIAPFRHFLRVQYRFQFEKADNTHDPQAVDFTSVCSVWWRRRVWKEQVFRFSIEPGKIRMAGDNGSGFEVVDFGDDRATARVAPTANHP